MATVLAIIPWHIGWGRGETLAWELPQIILIMLPAFLCYTGGQASGCIRHNTGGNRLYSCQQCPGTLAGTYDKYGRRVGQEITKLQHDFTIKLTYTTTKPPSCSFRCSFLQAINIDLYFPHVILSCNFGNSDQVTAHPWAVLGSSMCSCPDLPSYPRFKIIM